MADYGIGDLVRLLLGMQRERESGEVEITAREAFSRVVVRRGKIGLVEGGVLSDTLGRVLLEQGVLSDAQLQHALAEMRSQINRDDETGFGEILVRLGLLPVDEVERAMTDQTERKLARLLSFARVQIQVLPLGEMPRGFYPTPLEPQVVAGVRSNFERERMLEVLQPVMAERLTLVHERSDVRRRYRLGPIEGRLLAKLDGATRTSQVFADYREQELDPVPLVTALLLADEARVAGADAPVSIPRFEPLTSDPPKALSWRSAVRSFTPQSRFDIFPDGDPSALPGPPAGAREDFDDPELAPHDGPFDDFGELEVGLPEEGRQEELLSWPQKSEPVRSTRAPASSQPPASEAPPSDRGFPISSRGPGLFRGGAGEESARDDFFDTDPFGGAEPADPYHPTQPDQPRFELDEDVESIWQTDRTDPSPLTPAAQARRLRQRTPVGPLPREPLDDAAELLRRRLEAEEAFQRGKRLLMDGEDGHALNELVKAEDGFPEATEYRLLARWAEYRLCDDERLKVTMRHKLKALAMHAAREDRLLSSPHYVLGYLALDDGEEIAAARFFKLTVDRDRTNIDAQRRLRMLIKRMRKNK